MEKRIKLTIGNIEFEVTGNHELNSMVNELKKFVEIIDNEDELVTKSFRKSKRKNIPSSNVDIDYENQYNANFPESVIEMAKKTDFEPEQLLKIYDFGADISPPPLLIEVNKSARTAQQRIGLLLILYANKILTGKDKMSSQSISEVLEKSMIDSTELNKALNKEYSRYIRISGRTYRILYNGLAEAENLIKTYLDENQLGE